MVDEAAADRVGLLSRGLDSTVLFFHRLLPGRYHPYFLAEDLGAATFILLGFGFNAAFGVLSPWAHATAITVTFVLYIFVFLRVKRRLTGVGARSAMQDSLFFVTPVYLGLSWALGQNMLAALDALAFSLLLAVGWMRLGCFVSGCCHGRPSTHGVLYPEKVLRDAAGARLYTAAPFLGVRVFPLQLAESALLFATAIALWAREASLPRPDGTALALAVLVYGAVRFVSEYFRGHRHRPKYFGMSEAQLLSIVLVVVAVVALVWAG